ncbi:MAG: HAMP domain-containing protein [Spirochaetaceae bacterium]|nr:MAG: HAMP domain-containing protein [Spirochaetaceae bacterium]
MRTPRLPRLRDVPLSVQFLLLFVVSVVIPLSFGTVLSFQELNEQMSDRVQSIRQATLNQIGRNTDQLIEQTVNLTNYLVLSSSITDFLDADLDGMTDYELFRTYSQLTDVFTRVGASFVTERVFIIISNFDGNTHASWQHWNQDFRRLQALPWFPEPPDGTTANINVVGFVDNFVEAERLDTLFLVYRIILDPVDRSPKGIVLVALPGNEVLRVLSVERSFDSTSRAILSADGERLVALEPRIGAPESDRQLTITYRLNRGGLTLVESIDEGEILSEVRSTQLRLLLVILGVLIAFSGVGLVVSSAITRRIRELAEAAERIQRDTLDVPVATDAQDELGNLSRSIDAMMQRIRDLVATVYEEQADLRRLELELLQNQMHPHFLFNALHSIQTMATLSRAPNVADMTGALTNVLYYAVRSSDEAIPLSEELSILESYVLIQKMRWADAFEFEAYVAETLLEASVPKFILQPLVENSIRHGFRGRTAAGKVTVHAMVEEGTLFLSVRDNGAGFSTDVALHPQATGERSVGLANVSRRIQLMYGSAYGVSVMPVRDGAKVVLRLPFTRHHKLSTSTG